MLLELLEEDIVMHLEILHQLEELEELEELEDF